MAFPRQSFLILSALILCGGQIFAASSPKEQRDFSAAIGAFNDGMYPRAETEFGQFKKDYPDSADAPQAVLMQAQAEFKQGKFTNSIMLLANHGNMAKAGNLADRYVYWIGEAQFADSNFPAAAETFISIAEKFPKSPLRLNAAVESAAARGRLGEWTQTIWLMEDTNGVFQRAAQMDSGSELVSRGRLLLAQAKFALKDFGGEFAVLTSLNPQTLKPELGWQRANLLYQNRLAAGEIDAALSATTNLLQIARLEKNGGLYAESVEMHADALKKSGFTNDAMAAYQENLTNSAPVEQQRQAILKIAELAIAQAQFTGAELMLENFLAQFQNSPAADVVVLTLGELHLKNPAETNHLELALASFDNFLGRFTNSPLLGKVHLDRGWCNWTNNIPQSLKDFKMAADTLPFSEDLAVAKFKLGDALFAENDFAGARTNYESVADDFTNFPAVGESLGAEALYKQLRSCLKLNDVDGARNSLARILEIYPASGLADKGILLAGEGMTDLGQATNALVLFQKFEELSPGSSLLPEVELARARAYEQEGDWPSAIRIYDGWVGRYSTNILQSTNLPAVEYARALANFQAGDETNAFQLFTNFIAQFPASAWASAAQWWVGDHFFRAGDFAEAEKNYKYIFQNTNWQGSLLVRPAKMMAGRAAVGRGGYLDAITYFNELTSDTNCPPDLDAQALSAYGGALMQMPSDTNSPLANFEKAVSVFKFICQKYPTNEFGALAWGEIGDCDLQLAHYDGADGATNAYAQVLNSPYADISARSQAQFGLGLVLEKMAALAAGTNQIALLELARDNYYDVFKGNNLRQEQGEVPNPAWQKKAGLEAERLAEYFQEWKTAFAYYQDMIKNWPSLQPALENKKEKLLKEHPEAAQ